MRTISETYTDNPYVLGLLGGGVSVLATLSVSASFAALAGSSPSSETLLTLVAGFTGLHPVALLALRVAAVVYVVLLLPIYEEWFFRDVLWITDKGEAGKSNYFQLAHLLFQSCLFGCTRFGFGSNALSNAHAFLVGAVQGLTFALLREKTGGIKSGVIAHMTQRSLEVFC